MRIHEIDDNGQSDLAWMSVLTYLKGFHDGANLRGRFCFWVDDPVNTEPILYPAL